jgi:uncharacterized membrane protein YkvA (DUF1232 family)
VSDRVYNFAADAVQLCNRTKDLYGKVSSNDKAYGGLTDVYANALIRLKNRARSIKQNLFVLYLAYKDPRVSRYAKIFAACVVAYAFSPIDLIPDFIPILGYLDDLIIVPLGIALSLRMIPEAVIADCRVKAEELRKAGKPKNWLTGAVFILIWIVCAVWLGSLSYRFIVSGR